MLGYSRDNVARFFSTMTRDSRPLKAGQCPLMAAVPGLARPGEATTLDPPLVHAFDTETRRLYGSNEWHKLTAGQILAVIRGMP